MFMIRQFNVYDLILRISFKKTVRKRKLYTYQYLWTRNFPLLFFLSRQEFCIIFQFVHGLWVCGTVPLILEEFRDPYSNRLAGNITVTFSPDLQSVYNKKTCYIFSPNNLISKFNFQNYIHHCWRDLQESDRN